MQDKSVTLAGRNLNIATRARFEDVAQYTASIIRQEFYLKIFEKPIDI